METQFEDTITINSVTYYEQRAKIAKLETENEELTQRVSAMTAALAQAENDMNVAAGRLSALKTPTVVKDHDNGSGLAEPQTPLRAQRDFDTRVLSPSADRTYLCSRFDEKDTIKQIDGADWDPAEKKWFVHPQHDLQPFKQWIPGERIDLNVPYREKDLALSRGAKWDPDAKRWYIFQNADASLFAQWMPNAQGGGASASMPPEVAEPAAAAGAQN